MGNSRRLPPPGSFVTRCPCGCSLRTSDRVEQCPSACVQCPSACGCSLRTSDHVERAEREGRGQCCPVPGLPGAPRRQAWCLWLILEIERRPSSALGVPVCRTTVCDAPGGVRLASRAEAGVSRLPERQAVGATPLGACACVCDAPWGRAPVCATPLGACICRLALMAHFLAAGAAGRGATPLGACVCLCDALGGGRLSCATPLGERAPVV